MKSTNKTANSAQQSNINFKALFTGETYVTPVMFNPSAEDLRKIKNVREDFLRKTSIKSLQIHPLFLFCQRSC